MLVLHGNHTIIYNSMATIGIDFLQTAARYGSLEIIKYINENI